MHLDPLKHDKSPCSEVNSAVNRPFNSVIHVVYTPLQGTKLKVPTLNDK